MPALRRMAAVYGGSSAHHRALHEPKYARWLAGTVYLPDLPGADLSGYDGLIVPERLHAGRQQASRPRLLEVLGRGGTVVLFGDQTVYADQPRGWLPGVDWQHRPTNYWWWRQPGADSGLRPHHPAHPLWRHLTLEDATWHQHGVFHPPPGAEVLISTDDGGAVLYVDRHSTPGTLVVTSLDPMSHFGSYFMPATERFLDGFLPWLAAGHDEETVTP
ncbi:MAG TPA: hypothetical protein VFO65_04630 [Acidimicrobiales bacterium]|nr:hypothetical protein [Acidimicrobiales bacterium]